jgi:PAS domain S-box-containing protein
MSQILQWILLLIALLNVALAIASFRFYKSTGAISFGIFLLSLAFYAFTYSFELSQLTLADKIFWLTLENLSIPFIPTFVLFFSLQYVGKTNWLTSWGYILLLSISVVGLFCNITNPWFKLLYTDYFLEGSQQLTVLHTHKGIWYWVHQLYSVIAVGTFDILFIIMAIHGNKLQRRQAILTILGSLIPWITYAVYITGHSPLGIDLIPFSFAFFTSFCAWAMFRYKLFAFGPLALQSVFESMADAVIFIDQRNRIAGFNSSASNLFPQLLSTTAKSDFRDVLPDLVSKNSLYNNGISTEFDIETHRPGGSVYLHVKVAIIYNQRKQNVGKSIIISNITDRKLVETQLLENEAHLKKLISTKDKLFSIIGHDLRGPVSNISNLVRLLSEMKDSDADDRRQIIQMLETTSANTLKLTENILLWAKSQTEGFTFTPEKIHPYELVENSIELLTPSAKQKNILFLNKISNTSVLNADRNMLQLVIRNLLSNALKFTYYNGSIEVFASEDDSYYTISVKDTGVGIAEDVIPRLFSTDRSVRRNGTANEIGSGLGLVLCKEFIEKHNGSIDVKSTLNQGSTFSLSLPK